MNDKYKATRVFSSNCSKNNIIKLIFKLKKGSIRCNKTINF